MERVLSGVLMRLFMRLQGVGMREELYEQYKQAHPEELEQINGLYVYTAQVEAKREAARESKRERVAEWKRRLGYGNDHTGR